MATLIVTNGDCGAERLREAGLGHEILCWQDILHDGPVPMTANSAALTSVRAQFLSRIDPERRPAAELYQRDRVLAGSGLFKEVVVWFEHDLYDQLQLLQVLDQLGQRNFKDTKISMVSAAQYVGKLPPDDARILFARRTLVEDTHYELASRAWNAFRAATPEPLLQLLSDPGQPWEALPFLQDALWRLLEEYPGPDGLARTERQILTALQQSGGNLAARDLFMRSHHDMEEPVWLGDWPFAMRLQVLSRGRKPVIKLLAPMGAAADNANVVPFNQELASQVELLPSGNELLDGKSDFVASNGIDRWLGGVHLTRDNLWRWHGQTRSFTRR